MRFYSILIELEKVVSFVAIQLFIDLREYFLVSKLQWRSDEVVDSLELLYLVFELQEISFA